MMFRIPAILLSLALGASAASAGAAPLQLAVKQQVGRDVWSPPIIEPDHDTVWNVGMTVTVSWNTSNPPAKVTNPKGTLLLGYLLANGTGGENLDVDNPLASGFPLTDGEVDVVVPSVQSGGNYIVVLMGDSGNASPQFTIY